MASNADSLPSVSAPAHHRRRAAIVVFTILPLLALELTIRSRAATWRDYDTRYQLNAAMRKKAEWEKADRTDIVFFGSSRAYRGLVPEVFESATGMSAFNLGVGGAKIGEWQSFARQTLEQRKPRFVVLGVNAAEFRHDYLPIDAAHYTMDFADLVESFRFEGPALPVIGGFAWERLGETWQTFGRRHQIKLWLEEQTEPVFPKHAQLAREVRERITRLAPGDGYEHPWQIGERLRPKGVPPPHDPLPTSEARVSNFDPNAVAFARFDAFLDWFAARDITLMVVYIPNCPSVEARWQDDWRFVNRLHEICRAHDVHFVDGHRVEPPMTDDDFMDEVHVGYPLARRLSQLAAESALAARLLPSEGAFASIPEDSAEP